MTEDEDPALWKHLQETAVEAFTTKKMYTNFMGCDVDMRIGQDGRAYVIEVDPLPVFFYPTGSQLEDTDVRHGFPGSYRAVINTYITNHFLKHPGTRESRFNELAAIFDGIALSKPDEIAADIAALAPWTGTVIDLGCGRGDIGRALKVDPRNQITHLVGVDISKQALDAHGGDNVYNELIHSRMERFLAKQTSKVDHIFCDSALQFLPIEELDFVLARCFQLSRRSITLVIKDLESSPTYDGDTVDRLKPFYSDHRQAINTFQLQEGWILRPSTRLCQDGHRTLFHFYREDSENKGASNVE